MRVVMLLIAMAIACGVTADDGPPSATLQIVDKNGQPVSFCPLKHTSVTGHISGYVTRVDVTQVFDNPSTEAVEAIYVFPLSSNATVDYTDIETKLIAKMAASERVKYLGMLRLSKELKALKSDAVTIPGRIVIENGRVEVVVRSTDLSTEAVAKLKAVGFESTESDGAVHAAIGWIAIDKLSDLAAQDGVVLIDLPDYETK